MTQIELKRCIVCRRVKAVTEFSRHKGTKDGRQDRCKECKAAYQASHSEAHRASSQAYRESHQEEQRAYREARRETKAAYDQVYRAEHRKEANAHTRAWAKRNPEKIAAQNRAWRKRNPEKCAAYSRRRNASIAGATVGPIDYEAIERRDRMLCCVCGKNVVEKDLSFDHTIPLSLGGPHTQGNLRVCHRRCNSRRGAGRLPAQMVLV